MSLGRGHTDPEIGDKCTLNFSRRDDGSNIISMSSSSKKQDVDSNTSLFGVHAVEKLVHDNKKETKQNPVGLLRTLERQRR